MRSFIKTLSIATAITLAGSAAAQSNHTQAHPTIVLVHGTLGNGANWGDAFTDRTRPPAMPALALRDEPRYEDQAAFVARSIGAQLAPIDALYADRAERAVAGGMTTVPAIERQSRAR
jgi:pimeloyl-ACP methyl ester carboxylesterase